MRSRYTAYALKLGDYLLATWHPTARPAELEFALAPRRWIRLKIVRHESEGDDKEGEE